MSEAHKTTPSQLATSAPAAVSTPQPQRRWHRRAVFWAPVWLPTVVLAQIVALGLGPAIAERRRLAAAEHELSQRLAREQDEQAQLQRWQHAQSDPIYLERERRLLRTGEQPQTSK